MRPCAVSWKCTSASLRVRSMRSILATAFSRLLTAVAFDDFARKRSMKRSCFAISRSWRAAARSCSCRRAAFVLLVVAVVAGVALDAAVAQLEDARGDAVEELGVVRDDQRGALVLLQVVGEPVARRRVEVVRRLVEEHVLGPAHEDLRQRDAHLPAAAEVAAELLAVVRLEAEAIEHAADAALDAVAVERLEALEQRALPLDERVEVAVAALDLRRRHPRARARCARASGKAVHSSSKSVRCGVVAGLLLQVAERATAMAAAARRPACLRRRSGAAASTCRRRSARRGPRARPRRR